MKKTFLSLCLIFSLITNIHASDNTLERLNSEIVSIFAPFQNQNTIANLNFNAIETNSEHALKVELNSLFSKIGSKNTFEIKIDNLSYDYGDGLTPTTVFKSSIGIDLTKVLNQDDRNELVPKTIELIKDFASEYTERYEDAVFVKGEITSTTKDAEGNYTGLTALLSAKVDLNKLPEEISREDVMFTDTVVSLSLNVKTGFSMDAFMISNPEYLAFQTEQLGLKDVLDYLIAHDEEILNRIATLVMQLDFIATQIVEMDSSLRNFILNTKLSI